MSHKTWQEKTLVFLMRAAGCVALLAFPAVFLPVRWMAATHAWLGLGEFPASPLVDYLTRSISLLYGFYGVLLLVLAADVRRYTRVIAWVIWMHVVFGAIMIGVDLHAGLPRSWILFEGPPILALAVGMLYLLRFVPHER